MVYCLNSNLVGFVFDGGFNFDDLLLWNVGCFVIAGFGCCEFAFTLACFAAVLMWFIDDWWG